MKEKKKSFMALMNADDREMIIFGQSYDSESYRLGGIRYCDAVTFEAVMTLIERGYLSPDDAQNDSPTTQEIVNFVVHHNPDNWYFHGYVVSPERRDVRVTITGIASRKPIEGNDLIDFLKVFRYASILSADEGESAYCWYD